MKCKLSIQKKLKDLRIEKGLSLQELSEQTWISRASLGNYETDDYKEISHKAIITFPKTITLTIFLEATQAQIVMYSKLFKINFTKLEPYEFKTFTDILQRYSDLCKPVKGSGRAQSFRCISFSTIFFGNTITNMTRSFS